MGDGALIRPAAADELEALRGIERAAGERFREIGMPEIADDEPPPLPVLERARAAGLLWVAVDDDRPVGYLMAERVDGDLHVEQVSVHPAHAGRGIGRSLLDRAADHAGSLGATGLTLTTFEHVPWNAPYYARRGFRIVPEREWTPGLRAIRQHEVAIGLDRWPRVCMRRDLA